MAWPWSQDRDHSIQRALWGSVCSRPLAAEKPVPGRCKGELQRRHQPDLEVAASITLAVSAATAANAAQTGDSNPYNNYNADMLLKARGATLHAFELRRAMQLQVSDGKAAATPSPQIRKHSPRVKTPATAATVSTRAPTPASPRAATPAASFRLASPSSGRASPTQAQLDHAAARFEKLERARQTMTARRERIQELEQGIEDQTEKRLAQIALGTAPLLGARGEPVLPLPPPEVHEARLALQQRLRMLSANRCSKEAVRNVLIASQIQGDEDRDRPFEDHIRQTLGSGNFTERQKRPEERSSTEADFDRAPLRESFGQLAELSPSELVRQAETLASRHGTEDQWVRLASQLAARACDAELQEVLRMVRLVATAARRKQGMTAAGKNELLHVADHLLQSLIGRLQDSDICFLTKVVETMCETAMGTQAFLDMIMTLILGRHRCDRKTPSGQQALRMASALSCVASPESKLRLRLNGLPGSPSAVTNRRVMGILRQRITESIRTLSAEELSFISGFYLTRLCEEDDRKAIIIRMADLQVGLHEESQQCISRMLALQEVIQQELPNPLRWALPRHARQYLEQLKTLRLEGKLPWTLGLQAAEAKSDVAVERSEPVKLQRKEEHDKRKSEPADMAEIISSGRSRLEKLRGAWELPWESPSY
eukprot:TRINITY_DN90704_c0_g1_i1.p1 TRINITY_DN90704_c0_g1~~TRINITY_DN90704_c0_g1_i1.p1  ORF type:complete len:658 (-),score=142.77 TRINITY_DN90704_c0_g1_i1:16-1989(-)